MSAKKYDAEKVDLSLLPLPALEVTARALMHGEKKYSRDNYRAGFDTNRLVAAALRHIFTWQNGENLDKESGVSHLGHALAALSMLVTNLHEGTAKDGRYMPIDVDEIGRPKYRKDMTPEEFDRTSKASTEYFLQQVKEYQGDLDDDY